MALSDSRFSQRLTKGIGGSPRAVGGLWEDVSIDSLDKRDFVTYYNDFVKIDDWGAAVTGAGTATDFTVTAIGTMTVGTAAVRADVANGVLRLTPDATDNEGYHCQMTATDSAGELWVPAAGRVIVCEYRATCGDWDGQDYFLGLAETSATLLAATGALASDNLVGFHHQIADAGLIEAVHTGTADANETDVGDVNSAVFTNAEFHNFGIRIEGTNYVEFYVDGIRQQSAVMTNAFDDGMCISFGNVGSGAATDVLDIDYIIAVQSR
jgi:hypothetical protein